MWWWMTLMMNRQTFFCTRIRLHGANGCSNGNAVGFPVADPLRQTQRGEVRMGIELESFFIMKGFICALVVVTIAWCEDDATFGKGSISRERNSRWSRQKHFVHNQFVACPLSTFAIRIRSRFRQLR
jgi:uncharacterized protein YoaH (UPF0181 family)